MKTYLTGEYDRVLIEVIGNTVIVDEDAGIVLPPKHITELDRLSYIVKMIERECAVVPKGSFKFTPLYEVKKNEGFKGLSAEDGFKSENWKHFRAI